MLHSNTLPIRSAGLSSSLKPQPTRLLLPLTPSCCATSTAATTTTNPRRFFQSSSRPTTNTHNNHNNQSLLKPNHLTQQKRFESTTTTTTPPLSPSPSSSTSTLTSQPPLTWNAYLTLRKTRRRYNLASSLLSSLLTTAGGVTLISRLNLESMNIFGLDPFLVLGLSTVGSGGVGWLLGPFLGNAVFKVVYRRLGGQIDEVSVYGSVFGVLGTDGC